ncbi:hypothetical protein V6N13_053301 [Hibiscus sabdariffa]
MIFGNIQELCSTQWSLQINLKAGFSAKAACRKRKADYKLRALIAMLSCLMKMRKLSKQSDPDMLNASVHLVSSSLQTPKQDESKGSVDTTELVTVGSLPVKVNDLRLRIRTTKLTTYHEVV